MMTETLSQQALRTYGDHVKANGNRGHTVVDEWRSCQEPQCLAFRERAKTTPCYGRDCPVGQVQIEFIGVSPVLRRHEYGYLPCDHAFIDVWVDGQRYNIQIGDYESSDGTRRGLHITTESVDLQADKHSLNAVDLFLAPKARLVVREKP